MFGLNTLEFLLIAVGAVFLVGPERMPTYAAQLARAIRRLRVAAEGAKEQLVPELDGVDWRQYDPRRYDPRKIVADALAEPLEQLVSPVRDEYAGWKDSATAKPNLRHPVAPPNLPASPHLDARGHTLDNAAPPKESARSEAGPAHRSRDTRRHASDPLPEAPSFDREAT